MAPSTGGTPLLGQFLIAVDGFVTARNEAQLASYLALEPPFGDHYSRMIAELRTAYPRGREDALEQKCAAALHSTKGNDDTAPWGPFVKFMVQYLAYLRDVDADPSKYLQTYELLAELQTRANSALNHPTLGALMLPIVVTNARLVCRLAIGLDKQPELLAQVRAGAGVGGAGGDEGGSRETLPERAANTLRNAFVTCLNDRTSGLGRDGRPEGKKRGIYTIANLCLKILFQCRKTRNATQIFENIYNLSPPLAAYPKRERVAYLYYLGRFYFQHAHFYRAQLALQAAYDEAPARPDCAPQRRLLLIYLVASNLLLGRFPSPALLSRPEAHGLSAIFHPLCAAIAAGDIASFRAHLAPDAPHTAWLLHFRLLLPLRNRGEVLAWRSLVRRTWLLRGTRPDPTTRVAPTVDLRDLAAAWALLNRRAALALGAAAAAPDRDFDGVTFAADSDELDAADRTGTTTVESVLASLVDQGLLGGYISHARLKFAITGSKAKGGALAAGFPAPWAVLRARAERDGQRAVPGWKEAGVVAGGSAAPGGLGGGFGPGMVVNLSGLRPVGAA